VVHEGELAVQGVAGHELVAALAAVQVRGVRARCHLQNNIKRVDDKIKKGSKKQIKKGRRPTSRNKKMNGKRPKFEAASGGNIALTADRETTKGGEELT
jgi:hypothetical protein